MLPTYYVLNIENQIAKFAGLTPIFQTKQIIGTAPGSSTIGLSIRPKNNQLYVLATELDNNNRTTLYELDAESTPATASNPKILMTGVTEFPVDIAFVWMDFNPVADRLRLIIGSNGNVSINPDDGQVTVQTNISGMDGATIEEGIAYTNSIEPPSTTELYAIGFDDNGRKLFLQNPPASGVLTTIGPLRLNKKTFLLQ